MGLLNIYNTIDNTHETIVANGRLKDILPDVDFNHSLVIKAGNRLSGEYMVTEEDVLYVRKVPGSTAVIAGIAIVCAVIAVGVGVGSAIYAKKQSEEAKKQMEKAQRDAQNLAQQTQQLPFIRGAKNRKALGEAVQFLMGSVYNTPYNLTDGFYSIGGTDGVDSYYSAAFSCGFNSQKITKILIGNEAICTRSGGIDGELPFDSSSIYFQNNANRVEVRQPGEWLSLANCMQKVSATYAGAELKHDYGKDAVPVIVQAADNAMKIQVCIQFSSLRKYNSDSGNWGIRRAQVCPYWSNDGGQTWHMFIFAGSETEVITEGEVTTTYYNVFKRNVNHNIRFVAEKIFTAAESYGKQISIKVVKETPKEESNTQEDCALLWYQTFSYDAQKSNSSTLEACLIEEAELINKTTRVAYRIIADDSTQDILDELHCITEAAARTWNGTEWSSAKSATRNPASWLLEVLTSDVHKPSQLQDSEINLASFGALYEYCAENNFYCDGIVTKSEKKKDVIERILKLCNASIIINNEGLYEVCIDKEEENPVALLNAENIVSFSFSKSLAKKVDGSKVTFTNRDSWTVDTFYSMLDGGGYDYINDTVDTLAIEYATTYEHAYKIAQRQLRQRQLQPREIRVDVGHEGDYYPLYSTVLLQLPHLLQGLRSSVIKAIRYNVSLEITEIEISDLVDFVQGQRYGVIIQATTAYGHKMYSAEVTNETSTSSTRILTFAEPLSLSGETILPERGNHLSFGLLDENGRFSKITNVMKIYGVEPNGKDGFTLSLRDYNEDVYAYTPAGVPLPTYKSNITRPQQREKSVTLDDLNELRGQMNNSLNGILTRPDEISEPSNVQNVIAQASESGITVRWDSIPSTGLADSIKHYLIEVSKDSGETWTALAPSAANQSFYTFVRTGEGADGYPEAEDLSTWQFRVKAENIYGKKSIEWAVVYSVDTSEYGTWIPLQPIVANPRINHRTVTLNFSQRQACYGEVVFLVSIQRYDEYEADDPIWFKPDLQSDPYSGATAYKDFNATDPFIVDGVTYYFLKSTNSFTQTLPLEKQLAEAFLEVHRGEGVIERLKANEGGAVDIDLEVISGSAITQAIDTNYYYRIWCLNATTGVRSEEFSQVLITAKATSAYDIVDAAIITNKLADEAVTIDKLHANCVTAEKLYSRNLTTTGAFIGSIYGAEIDTVEFVLASVYQEGVEYYVYDSETQTYVKPVIQPTAETFDEGTYYIKNENWGMPKQTADNFWKGLDSDNPEFRIGNDIDAEMFELATGKTNTEAEYMHYLSKTTTYNYDYNDPDTHQDVSGSVTLQRGIYFKIANFIVTAINSIIKGVFYIKNKLTGRNFIEVNPETTATEDAAQVPAETMRINGDVSIGSKAGNTAGALSVTGNVSSGGDITATGDVSVGDDLGVTGDATVGGALGVTGNQTVGGTSTITGALSAASFSTSGNITASNGTVKGKVVDINGFKITGVSFDYGTATLSITYQ